MNEKIAGKLFQALVIGGSMIGTASAATVSVPKAGATSFDAAAAQKLVVNEHTTWGAL